jgi:hypothetical protein
MVVGREGRRLGSNEARLRPADYRYRTDALQSVGAGG